MSPRLILACLLLTLPVSAGVEEQRFMRSNIVPLPEPETTWLGWPVAGTPLHPEVQHLTIQHIKAHEAYEIGLRSDGIVVWRKRTQE